MPEESTEAGLEYVPDVPDSRNMQQENETKVKDLEMKLRRAQDQTLMYAKKSRALAQESLQMSTKLINKATQIQNKVQTVLTTNYELHENPIPRLFIVLPVLILDPSAPATTFTPPNDQRKFRVHFLCECGKHTRPLPSSKVNHIHFVEHEGYEIEHPIEFFEKYGPFIRSLSQLIRMGVDCGTVSIPSLMGMSQQRQQRNDPGSISRNGDVGHETLRNQILDTRLAEAMDYLASLETLDPPENDSNFHDTIEYFNGTDIKHLQAYIKIPPQDEQNLANLYRIITDQGHVKWICEEHYQSSIHYQNEVNFQHEISSLKGQYDLRTGRAKVQLMSAQDAAQFCRSMSKVHNLQELDIGIRWPFTESDVQKLVQAIQDSKVRALTLDGGKVKSDPSPKRIAFGKKYDPLLRIIFGSRIGSLTIKNIPSMMLRISTKQPQPLTQAYSIRALHFENVGALDSTAFDKNGATHSVGSSFIIGNSNSRSSSLAFLRNLTTNLHALTEISVPGMNIQDEGIGLITGQGNLHRTLRHINLSNNGLTAEGGRRLGIFLSREKIVAHLDIGMNSIGDETLPLIIDALGPKLSVLNLEGTGFRDHAARALDRMIETYNSPLDLEPQLEYLNLASNGWTTSSVQSLGRIIMRMRLRIPPPSSPSISESGYRKPDKPGHLEMGAAEAFLVVNSMIRTDQLSLATDKPWYQQPNCLNQYVALTATKESYGHTSTKAQDSIAANSKLKVLRLSDAGLSEGAARYLTGLLDVNILTKMDLRRCTRIFKPREMLTILARTYPHSSYLQEDDMIQRSPQGVPQSPAPFGVMGSPQNCLRFLHLNSVGVDDHVARILAQDLESSWCSLERLDIGSNHLTYQGINLILDALCQNTSLQHLNLGQNFSTFHTSYTSALAKGTRDTFKRFMITNKTLQILYYICTDIDVVAQGLSANSTIRSLVFDRLEGSLGDMETFGRALAMNETLMRLKVYDSRQPPFLDAFYRTGQQPTRYVEPFKDIKQEAIKIIEKGITFNYTLIEFQWPEMFDRQQPCTERLEAILTRNMSLLKNGGVAVGNGHDVIGTHDGSSNDSGTKGRSSILRGRISRGLSVLSTTSTISTISDNSSTSSLSSPTSPMHHIKDQMLIRSQSGIAPVSPIDGYSSYSIHSSSSSSLGGVYNGIGNGAAGNSNHRNPGGSSAWDERKLSMLELSPRTLNILRSTPSRDQKKAFVQQQNILLQSQPEQQPHEQQKQQKQPQSRAHAEPHIMQRFKR